MSGRQRINGHVQDAAPVDPWRLPLERLHGKIGDDGVERIATQVIFDVLEVPQRARGAGACRRLATCQGPGAQPARAARTDQGLCTRPYTLAALVTRDPSYPLFARLRARYCQCPLCTPERPFAALPRNDALCQYRPKCVAAKTLY